MTREQRIGVIGGGLAGLSAARLLTSGGFDVTVFDKGRRPGGRMATRESQGRSFDHGAQFFTVRDPRFEREVAAWVDRGLVAEWSARFVLIDGDRTQSAKMSRRFVGVPRMRAVPEFLAEGLDVRTGILVGSVTRQRDAWLVDRADGERLGEFDRLVVNLPAPQAAALLRPAVPALSDIAAVAAYDPCWAVMAEFDGPVGLVFDAAFIRDRPLSWVARDSARPGRRPGERWVLHGSPAWSAHYLEDDPSSIADRLLEEFATLGGTQLQAQFVRAHRWRYALPAVTHRSRYVLDDELSIGLCGDWCGGPRVEGAFLSGVGLAERMVVAG